MEYIRQFAAYVRTYRSFPTLPELLAYFEKAWKDFSAIKPVSAD